MTKPLKADILVVDDDPKVIEILSGYLQDAGYKTMSASSGKRALQLAREYQPFAITLDIMMPEMDGFETMARIRSEYHYKKLPLIALTAKAMKGDRHKCIEAGANDYLAKPVDKIGRAHV